MGRSRNEMFESLITALGGRVAEELMMDDISTGASGDIQSATRTARNMVTRYGMSEKLGPILYGSEHSSDAVFLGRDFSSGDNYSEQTAAQIDEEVRRLIAEAHDKCREILREHMDKLEFVAQYLLSHETMDGDQFKAAMESEEPTVEALEAIAEEKARRSREANEERERRCREEAEKIRAEQEAAQRAEESVSDAANPFDRETPKDQ
jgi:cell division protease FtsH